MSAADKFCSIRVVPVEEIPIVWARVRPSVCKVLSLMVDAPWATPAATLKKLLAEKTFLVLCDGSGGEYGAIVAFSNTPAYKVGRILHAFGRGMRANDVDVFHQWMKMQGCKYVEATVRTGSRQRLFARFGYRYEYTLLRKDLT